MPLLNSATREEDVRAAGRKPYRLLDELPEISVGDSDQGIFAQRDNLDTLKPKLPFYAGQVTCIYIDGRSPSHLEKRHCELRTDQTAYNFTLYCYRRIQ